MTIKSQSVLDASASLRALRNNTENDNVETANPLSTNVAGEQYGVAVARNAVQTRGMVFWTGLIGIAMMAYVYGLDNNTGYAWFTYASMEFNNFSYYTTISVIQMVMVAGFKFPIAKLADVFGRWQAYLVSVVCWVVGFIIIACSKKMTDLAAGSVFYAIGNTGVQIMQQIVIADYISTRWRGAAIGLASFPYLINFVIAPEIVAALANSMEQDQPWRWGPGFMLICAAVACIPIVWALRKTEQLAKAAGEVTTHPYKIMHRFNREIHGRFYSFMKVLKQFAVDIDAVGLILIVGGWLPILLAVQLAGRQEDQWRTPWIIVMLCIGILLVISCVFWEIFFAPRYSPNPLISPKWRKSKDVHIATWLGFFDFVSFYLTWTPAYTWIQIAFDWNAKGASYFSQTQSLTMTVFGIIAGFISVMTKRYKWSIVTGSIVRAIGIVAMIFWRTADSNNFQVMVPQILQGLGGGILGVTLQVAAQVSVTQENVATVTAYLLLVTEMGGACGSAIVGAIQTMILPGLLKKELPWMSQEELDTIYAMPTMVLGDYPMGTVSRIGIINAYTTYLNRLLIVGLILSLPTIVCAFFLSNRTLNDKQTCVEDDDQKEEGNSDNLNVESDGDEVVGFEALRQVC